MRISTTIFFTFFVSSGFALSVDTSILGSIRQRADLDNPAVEERASAVAPKDILNPIVKPRECEEPAEPEEPSEAERKKGAKRPKRPARPC
ncbi:uncharacterized protein CTRU02_201197 [Colletotrichum truncatum]|uniref:Uncharacterized protein n=1 Tax=Colletotrichum truncatum TaxID=5467 RepID=A0ACC3ZGU3_COLTU|nr:uncharacterized protein CTRU02_07983 [Colletotrichum truncatum]KAF6790463.1 hypothetical protein CTRU02_07983 [Colletotrichum truncatum]